MDTIELYKYCIGIHDTLIILCDTSFLNYFTLEVPDEEKFLTAVRRDFGVKYVHIFTTSCVHRYMCDNQDKNPYLVAQQYAETIKRDCNHPEPRHPEDCLAEFFKRMALQNPYCLATMNHGFCRKLGKRTELPVLLGLEGRPIFPQMSKVQQKRLQDIKEERLLGETQEHGKEQGNSTLKAKAKKEGESALKSKRKLKESQEQGNSTLKAKAKKEGESASKSERKLKESQHGKEQGNSTSKAKVKKEGESASKSKRKLKETQASYHRQMAKAMFSEDQ